MKPLNEKYFINQNRNDENIDIYLHDDEQVLWRGKPKKSCFILSSFVKTLPIALIWLAFDITFITILFTQMPEIPTGLIVFLVIFFLFHLFPVWRYIYLITSANKRQKKEEYLFTNKRIIVQKGNVASSIESIDYSSLVSINLKIGLVEKMFKVGDIYILATGAKTVLEDIEDPQFITAKLQKIAQDIKTDIIYPNDLRPTTNHGYNTEYRSDN